MLSWTTLQPCEKLCLSTNKQTHHSSSTVAVHPDHLDVKVLHGTIPKEYLHFECSGLCQEWKRKIVVYAYKNALTAQLRAQIARKPPSHLCETLSLCRWLRSRTLLVSHQRRRLPRRSTLMCNFQKDAKSESAMPEMGVWW